MSLSFLTFLFNQKPVQKNFAAIEFVPMNHTVTNKPFMEILFAIRFGKETDNSSFMHTTTNIFLPISKSKICRIL